ncbi:MAG: MATE family efflux transporter [Oscillospiraceae bacterium]|nr:MATE family efflux transporter [Oscillospiraceae bacterium]
MAAERPDLRREKFIRMTTAPVQKLVLRLSLPTIASMLVTALYNMADTYFVSSIGGYEGTCAIAAVSVSLSVMALIQALGFFVGQGASNFISRALGRKDVEKASEMAATGLFLALLIGGAVAVLGELYTAPIARFLGADEEFVGPASDYLRWIFAAAPLMTGSFCLNNQLRFQGNALYGMVGVVSGALLNIGLDPLFIRGFGMGAEGASLATAISQGVGFCILLGGTFRGDNLRIHPSRVRVTWENLGYILQGGLPSLLRQGCGSVAVLILNQTAGSIGEADPAIGRAALIAAFGLVSKVMMMANNVVIGLGQGYQPVCGFNYGAGQYSRVRQAFWFLVRVIACWCALMVLLGELFAPRVVSLFRDAEPRVRELAAVILRCQCAACFVNCWVVPSNMTQQTMGWMFSASLLAMARQGLFLIPMVLLLPRFYGLTGLELAQPVSDLCTFCLAIPLQARVLRHLQQPDRELAP